MMCSKLILVFFIFNTVCLETIEAEVSMEEDSVEFKIENLLIEFLTDLGKFSYQILDTHRLLILGKEQNILHATKVLLESGTPYLIGNEAATTVHPLKIGGNRVVLFFIDGFSDSEVNLTFAQLPNDFKCRTLIISMREDRTYQSIATTILSAVKMKLRNVMFARFDGQVIKVYGRVVNASCEQEIRLMNKWIPMKGFRKSTAVLGHDLALDERGCPMVVSTFKIPPTMMLREGENKSWEMSGGVEGHLVKTVAEYLNMVPVVKVPFVKQRLWLTSNGTALGIIGEVAREVASFGIGQIERTMERATMVDFTSGYNPECMAWTVPLRNKYNYNVVTSEFPLTTWIMVISSVSLGCGLACAISKLNIGYSKYYLNVFDIIAMTLNYSIPRPPTSLLFRLLFLLYLHYSRVISTAYSTSLASILTTTTATSEIVDEEGILAAGLRTAGSQSSLATLIAQITPNSTRAELINRYEVTTSDAEALARITDHRDIAYLRQYSTIDYIAKKSLINGKPVNFALLPGCVSSYESVIVTPKGSRLTGEVDNIILRLLEAGLAGHWSSLDQTSRVRIRSWTYTSHTLTRLESIFVLYLCCLIPASLVFVAELIVFKLKLNWFTR